MKAEEYGLDFTVTLTAEDAKFTDEAVAAGIPLIVVCMCRDALRKLVASEREACAVIAFNAKTYLEAAESIRARGQTQPIVRITTPEDIAKIKSKWEPILPGGGIGSHPDIQARKEGDLIVADLPQVPTGSGGIYKEPEPVAYINVEKRELEWAKLTRWETPTTVKMDKVPLYTTPQKREWHELTDGEIATIKTKYEFGVNSHSFINAVRELETWLKERNNG